MGKLIQMNVLVVGLKGVGVETGAWRRSRAPESRFPRRGGAASGCVPARTRVCAPASAQQRTSCSRARAP
jgi:hypothetical protein